MNEIFLLYLFTRLGAIQTILFIGAVFSSVALFSLGIMLMATAASNYHKEEHAFSKRAIKYPITTLSICGLLLLIVPSQKDAMFIVAGAGVLEAAKTETAQRLASKSVQVIEGFIDNYLEKDKKK